MPQNNFRKGQKICWSAKTGIKAERRALENWPGEWEIKSVGVPTAGRYRNVRCLFIHPPEQNKRARWIPEEWVIQEKPR